MPIFQSLENNDKVFRELKRPPIIINDLHNNTTADREKIERLIITTYSGDMVSALPSCTCGQTKGEFSRNVICPACNTSVVASIENTIEPLVWFRRPNGVNKLMPPVMWIMLEKRFGRSKFSLLRWLTDTAYSPPVNYPPFVDKIIKAGFQRGYNYFVDNFFMIMDFLFSMREFKLKNEEKDYLAELIQEYKDIIFSDHIPLLNKSLLIIEKTSLATYIDSTVPMALDAIEMLVSIDKDFYDQTGSVKENRTARALYNLSCKFFNEYFKKIVSGKPGLLRHDIGGSRFDFSARAVISSITDSHKYDEIEVPWGIGLTIFRPMLINKLIKKSGMLVNDAVSLILSHIGVYHPLLDSYMKEIIAETRDGRYPVLINRFPSLLQGSIQRVYIPRVKTDPKDCTIGISILITTAPNADFDGDTMSIVLSLDNKMADAWYPLSPMFNILEMSEPLKISNNIKLPKPVIATIGNWLAD